MVKPGNDVEVQEDDWKTFTLQKSKKNYKPQEWKFVEINHEIISIESVEFPDKFFEAYELNATDGTNKSSHAIRVEQTGKDEWKDFAKGQYRVNR